MILVTRNVEGKGRFRTVAPDSRLLRPAGDSLGLFLYQYLDGIDNNNNNNNDDDYDDDDYDDDDDDKWNQLFHATRLFIYSDTSASEDNSFRNHIC